MYVDDMLVPVPTSAPDRVEQLSSGEGRARPGGQGGEQVELGASQVELGAGEGDLPGLDVQDTVGEGERGGLLRLGCAGNRARERRFERGQGFANSCVPFR